jgi:Fe-S-cluster containining protein
MSKKKEKTCEGCGGKCCSYAAVEVYAPTSVDEWEDMVFYIYHGAKVSVAQDGRKRRWLLEFKGKCQHLKTNHKCGIYEHRPKGCREHSIEECEHHTSEEIRDIGTVEELLKLMEDVGRGKWVAKLRERINVK